MSANIPRKALAVFLAAASSLLLASTRSALAAETLTMIQLQDLHGNLLPHAGIIRNPDRSERYVTQGGGVAKAKTLVDEIRADNPKSLLLAVGDSTQGSAEVLYTVGAAIKQVAPDRYLHPVHMMRRFLDSLPHQLITEAQFGTGRIRTVDPTKLPSHPDYLVDPPVSIGDRTLVQPIQGTGPGFFARLLELFR